MNVRQKFNQYATSYDSSRQKLIPCFTDFYGAVLKAIPFAKTAQLAALDLGAGTGLLSQVILAEFTNTKMSLIDISEEMLGIAKERLAEHKDVTYGVLDYATNFPAEQYDLIVSALSIHHLTDGDKKQLFGQIKSALKPGGIFVNADQVLGESPEIEAMHQATWLQEVQDNGVTQTALAEAQDRMLEDKMTTLSR